MSERSEVLAKRVVEAANAGGLSLATAESCTAGAIASALAAAPGAGNCVHGGVVAYSKQMKQEILGVPGDLLRKKGAVCAEVAEAMAQGILTRSPADVAVAITGVAGPEPDEDRNPVGLIFCAAARRGGGTEQVCLRSSEQDRDAILDEGMCAALVLLLAACTDRKG
jgi:nicotinamide-nucleotide amidase